MGGLSQLLYGMAEGRVDWTVRYAENIVRVGQEVPWACWLQTAAFYRATQLVPPALSQIAGVQIRLPLFARFALLLTPAAVGLLVEVARKQERGRLRSWIYPIYANMGGFALGAITLSYLALFPKKPWESLGALSSFVLSLWLADSFKPDHRRDLVRAALLALVTVQGWLGGGLFEKAISTFNIAVEVLEFLPEEEVNNREHGDLTTALQLELPDHQSVDLDKFQALFTAIEWKDEALSHLKRGVDRDSRWIGEFKGRSGNKEETYIAEGIERYITSIRGQAITIGGPRDYGRITHLAYLLAELAPQLEGERQRELLIQIGRAGWMNGPLCLRHSEELYFKYCGKSKGGVKDDYLHRLAKEREAIFKRLVESVQATPGTIWKHSRWLGNPDQLHHWNSMVAAFSTELGLPGRELAFDDPMANTSRFGRLWTRWQYQELVPEFWKAYTETFIIDKTHDWIRLGNLREDRVRECLEDQGQLKDKGLARHFALESGAIPKSRKKSTPHVTFSPSAKKVDGSEQSSNLRRTVPGHSGRSQLPSSSLPQHGNGSYSSRSREGGAPL